jgi:CheY-specific phosphatase CheX
MLAEYLNPFIIGALEVFDEVAQIELKKSDVVLKENTAPGNEIAIIMDVTGYLTGQVVYSFKEHTAQRIVQAMMPKSTPEKQAEYLYDALSSMANMITGHATILLAGREQVILITPPLVRVGPKNMAEFLQRKTISVVFNSRFGSMEVNISLVLTKG